jgi:hypothetical protein
MTALVVAGLGGAACRVGETGMVIDDRVNEVAAAKTGHLVGDLRGVAT